jgi:hypothetical protein
MKSNGKECGFSPAARWIWADSAAADAWWMFRKSMVLPADCREARLCVTAAFHYLLYVNGTLVTRGPARSYDFRKAYDVVDIRPYLRPGEANVLAILAPSHKTEGRRGVLAELTWHDARRERFAVATDCQWKVRRHDAFKTGPAGWLLSAGLLLGREELFDARRETPGWNSPAFDDSGWGAACELGPAGMAPWTTLEPSGIGLLSDDPFLPRSFTAIELARLRPGYRIRLVSPDPYINATKLYATEVSCAAPAVVRFCVDIHPFGGTKLVYLNGQRAVPDHVTGEVVFPAGANLLFVRQSGYFTCELELLLETDAELSFSSRRILGASDAPWALIAFPAGTVNYPWHEAAASIPEPPELLRLLAAPTAGQIPDDLWAGFVPVAMEAGSVSLDVTTQYAYRVSGGHTDPIIEKGHPRLSAGPALALHLCNPHNLFHAHADPMIIMPTPGYDVHFVVDFGREMIGYIEFTVDAPAGTVFDAQCFEMFNPTGVAWMYHNGFRYICREGPQTFTSHFRRGFRYVSITVRGFNRPVKIYSLRCRLTAYPVQEHGSFECSDWQVNQAYRMSIDTAAVCMLDTYVDCPGHEQSFWVGDARITALINLLAFGAYDLNQHSISLVGQSLSPEWVNEYWPNDERYKSGRYLPIAAFPNYPEGGLPMWSFLWIMQCWDHYMHGGNADDLKENYGYVAETLRHCRLLTNERGLFDMPGAWNLIEWGATDLSPYGEVTANNVLLVHCLRLAAQMASAMGLDEKAREHAAESDERQAAVNRFCWDSQRQAYLDTVRDDLAYQRYLEICQVKGWEPLKWENYLGCLRVSEQTNTLAALCGCVPPERLEAVKRIVRRVKEGRFIHSSPAGRSPGAPSEKEAPGGIVAIGSPFFLFFSLGALFQIGEGRMALDVMRSEWGKMAAAGLRTCPEGFGRTRSAAHAWSAAPAVYLPSHVLGIRPVEPGYRKFIVDPCPGDLLWARGSVATPYGPIYVSWQRNDRNDVEISCSAPQECRRVDQSALRH